MTDLTQREVLTALGVTELALPDPETAPFAAFLMRSVLLGRLEKVFGERLLMASLIGRIGDHELDHWVTATDKRWHQWAVRQPKHPTTAQLKRLAREETRRHAVNAA